MTCGIYQIKNKINGKIYIGQSKNIESRLLNHIWALKRKDSSHENQHLINAFHKYGEENFEASIIAICPKDKLDLFEKWFIYITGCMNPKYGYNKQPGGLFVPTFKKHTHTTTAKKKISKMLTNRELSQDTKKKNK